MWGVDYLAGAESERKHIGYNMNAASVASLGCVCTEGVVLWRVVEEDSVARFEFGRHGWREVAVVVNGRRYLNTQIPRLGAVGAQQCAHAFVAA